jgi:Imidazolonepropionase and related amidohydrolases
LAAGTINSAFSIDKDNEYGNIEVGKKASFIILNENPNKIGYEFYKDPILDVIREGRPVRGEIDF